MEFQVDSLKLQRCLDFCHPEKMAEMIPNKFHFARIYVCRKWPAATKKNTNYRNNSPTDFPRNFIFLEKMPKEKFFQITGILRWKMTVEIPCTKHLPRWVSGRTNSSLLCTSTAAHRDPFRSLMYSQGTSGVVIFRSSRKINGCFERFP